MLWWLSSAQSRCRVRLRPAAQCLKSKTSSLIYLDNNMALSDAEALKMDRSTAAEYICGCVFMRSQDSGLAPHHIVTST